MNERHWHEKFLSATGILCGLLIQAGVSLALAKESTMSPGDGGFDEGGPAIGVILKQAQAAAARQPKLTELRETPPLPAGSKVYQVKRRLTKDRGEGFTQFERLGVEGITENEALAACQADGWLNCAVISSQIEKCDKFECVATASAREAAKLPGVRYKLVKADSGTWETPHKLPAIEQHGLIKAARNAALAKCRNKGLLDCVVIGPGSGVFDWYTSAPVWDKFDYFTYTLRWFYLGRAEATARGRKR